MSALGISYSASQTLKFNQAVFRDNAPVTLRSEMYLRCFWASYIKQCINDFHEITASRAGDVTDVPLPLDQEEYEKATSLDYIFEKHNVVTVSSPASEFRSRKKGQFNILIVNFYHLW
jgi:hypothetical protein